MLQRVSVKKLFGRFDYDIDMKSDGVTILTGPNGFGKSTVAKAIEYVAVH
ncbi:AAA family ATPase [Paludicola sp. MB14-C6]|nr:AAA family ATPase [Paludicola sp. MB14-C6]WMJ23446.1 AAA family ATPase [Paludicola sp. MB14-C6]